MISEYRTAPVVFVCMPFAPVQYPSIALGLLKAALNEAAIQSETYYFNLDFARWIGLPLYYELADGEASSYRMAGEELFSRDLFPDLDPTGSTYEAFLRTPMPGYQASVTDEYCAQLRLARGRVADFLDLCLRKVMELRPAVVAFTNVFQQNSASLALAKRLKQAEPSTSIIFGGANCEGVMGQEMLRCFDFLDIVVSGEADDIIVPLVKSLLNHTGPLDIPGVFVQRYAASMMAERSPIVRNLDSLPIPDYDDFFTQLQSTGLRDELTPRLLFESSRGCWWGEKHHCTFCGLNGSSMAYRSKTPVRAVHELHYLTKRYGVKAVSVVDNILSMGYVRGDFFEELQHEQELQLFFEVKSNLNRQDLARMKASGVVEVQPGIESLSSSVLQLMRKGVKGIQNIEFLKNCTELGITAHWNVIWGFPGEDAGEYAHMAKLATLLHHLTPPSSASRLRLDRFSPNFDLSETMGFTAVHPFLAYDLVYDLPAESRERLAYYFDYSYADGRDINAYTQQLADAIKLWQTNHASSALFFFESSRRLLIWDFRSCAKRTLSIASDLAREVLLFCQTRHGLRKLFSHFGAVYGGSDGISAELQSVVAKLEDAGLVYIEEEEALGLAVSHPPFDLPRQILQQMLKFLDCVAEVRSGSWRIPAERLTDWTL